MHPSGDARGCNKGRRKETMNEKKEPIRPVHEVRLGKIRASVWGNRTNGATWYTVTLSRLYRGKDGKWQQAESFGPEDMPVIAAIAAELTRWYLTQAEASEGEE
jgi:hypothetical protein